VKEILAILKKTAEGKSNVVPPILEAVKAYATIGEISDTLREVFGEYRER
jgi:methylmalonyl-CoA mutase N-terminal domain/subunit